MEEHTAWICPFIDEMTGLKAWSHWLEDLGDDLLPKLMSRAIGCAGVLLRGINKVEGEFALMALGYKIARFTNMFSFYELKGSMMAAQGAAVPLPVATVAHM